MTAVSTERTTTQVYRVYIKAPPERIWEAITTSEWTQKYGYGSPAEFDLRPGGAYRSLPTQPMKDGGAPDVVVDGEVIEADPPRRLVQTWRILWDPEMTAEGFTRLTYDIEAGERGVTTLTVTHELEDAPLTAQQVAGEVPNAGGGWPMILSDLKSLLETGSALWS